MRPLADAPRTPPRRIVFFGTPAEAVPPLRALVDAGYEIALAVTQPDKRRGRGGSLHPSPVKEAAEALGVAVSHRVDDALQAGADLGVLVAFGRLIKRHVLEVLPIVNVHFSLLPRWRGAAPVERAILAGDEETGVCLMQLVEALDAGPVYACRTVPIGTDETAGSLRDRLVAEGTALLLEHLAAGLPEPARQEGEPTYADKLEVDDFRLDWTRGAAELERVVRAGDGRAFTTFRGGRFKIHRAERERHHRNGLAAGEIDGDLVGTAEGVLRLVEVQPEGRPRLAAEAWARGARLEPGERLGT